MRIAIVAGSARCLWPDLAQAQALAPHAAIIAVNVTAQFLPRVDHIVSLHKDLPGLLRILRVHMDMALKEHAPATITHSIRMAHGIDRVWDLPATGTSSLLGARVALGLGYERVILAGVPLDSSGRFFDPPGVSQWDWDGPQGDPTREAWRAAKDTEFGGAVFSLSGWTHTLLGEPPG